MSHTGVNENASKAPNVKGMEPTLLPGNRPEAASTEPVANDSKSADKKPRSTFSKVLRGLGVLLTAPISLPYIAGFKMKGILEPYMIEAEKSKMRQSGKLGRDRKEKIDQGAAGMFNAVMGLGTIWGAVSFCLTPAVYTLLVATTVISPAVAPLLVIGAVGASFGVGMTACGIQMIRGKDPHGYEKKQDPNARTGVADMRPGDPDNASKLGPSNQLNNSFGPVSGVTRDPQGNLVREEPAREMKRVVAEEPARPMRRIKHDPGANSGAAAT